ncbi:uncharacterized protein L969DRAFT_54397 [Mixia osmundae IAM 14324]|uniref:uncharacterized protein n=1 Tax=Mixia osmundae (strain CBS 9802 / IAM 14324 / JCM 22182 / KY 12970) TaxID=764103 RepID=UPI0004A5520F|nr:uncharacterized protein L969DRAFT_54397 [Mixia osmundae IAM 14324]KEI36723.1 hypothetical protein L969DRAFT_54397 [Mixia osmundae IAM 14324]
MSTVRCLCQLRSRRVYNDLRTSSRLLPRARRAQHTAAKPRPDRRDELRLRRVTQIFGYGVLATCVGLAWSFREDWMHAARADFTPEPAGSASAAPKTRIDPDTSLAFPLSLEPKSIQPASPLVLARQGVRTVSFLSVRVYTAGLYAEERLLRNLSKLQGFSEPSFGKDTIVRPSRDINALEGEALIASLLDEPVDFVVRIVPTRNTDGSHMRDGFFRSIQARLKLAERSGRIDEATADNVSASLNELKSLFPVGKIAKGNELLLIRRGTDGALLVEYEGNASTLQNPWISKQLLLAYFADQPISAKAKDSFAQGLVDAVLNGLQLAGHSQQPAKVAVKGPCLTASANLKHQRTISSMERPPRQAQAQLGVAVTSGQMGHFGPSSGQARLASESGGNTAKPPSNWRKASNQTQQPAQQRQASAAQPGTASSNGTATQWNGPSNSGQGSQRAKSPSVSMQPKQENRSNPQGATGPAQNGSAPLASLGPTPAALGIMADRLDFIVKALIGSRVVATIPSGVAYEGILSASTTMDSGELTVVLTRAHSVEAGSQETMKSLLSIAASDLVDLKAAAPVDLHAISAAAFPTGAANGDSFRTDADISGTPTSAGDGRALQKWSGAGDEDGSLESAALLSPTKGKWDQFEVNEKLFGAKTDFDEEIYTTKLDRSGKDFKDKERRAARLAQDILSSTSSNAHVQEERNVVTQGDALDEEDKYSGVIRGPNAYIPPSARKASAAAGPPAARESPSVSPSVSKTPLPTPGMSNSAASLALMQHVGAMRDSGATREPSSVSETIVRDQFREFVGSEKERMQRKKDAQAKKVKEIQIAELREFSTGFKLRTPFPAELAPLVGKSPKASDRPMPSSTAVSPNDSVTPLRATLEARPTSSSAPRPPPSISRYSIVPPIPPFNPAKAAAARSAAAGGLPASASTSAIARAASPGAVQPATVKAPSPSLTPAPATSTSKINPKAPAFRPNANAAVFTPGASTSALNKSPLRKPAVLPPSDPFFGNKPIKKTKPIYVKEDFHPFKAGPPAEARNTPPAWEYSGKPYRQFLPALPYASQGPSQANSADGDSMPTPLMQPMPGPGFPVYQHYPPQFQRFASGAPPQMQHLPPQMHFMPQQHFGPMQFVPQVAMGSPGPAMYTPAMSPVPRGRGPPVQPQGQPFIYQGPPGGLAPQQFAAMDAQRPQ